MHWVDQICAEFNISINELARISSISPGALGNAKKRNTPLNKTNYGNVIKIANALKLTPEDLVSKYDN